MLAVVACTGSTAEDLDATPPAPPAPAGTVLDGRLVTEDGRARTYRLYVPSSLPGDAVPLLVALHGGGGNGAQFAATSNFDGLAEANGFLVVYPDGSPTRLGPRNLVWNAGRCCAVAAADRDDVDDVGFVVALVTELRARYRIDADRVYASGHSNGAMLSLRLACERSDVVVAIAYLAGALMVDDCDPARPVSALAVHGTADRNVPIEGGRGEQSTTRLDFPPPRAALERLAARDGCTGGEPAVTSTPNPDVHVERWERCPPGIGVELVVIEGANHAWMGSPEPGPTESRIGPAYAAFDMSAAAWSFLAAHPRP